jgi:hypothetical protein
MNNRRNWQRKAQNAAQRAAAAKNQSFFENQILAKSAAAKHAGTCLAKSN